MSTGSWVSSALACIIILAAAAAIGTGTVLCNSTSQNRPANDLAVVAKPTPIPGPQALFRTELRGETHRQPTAIRTPVPVPTPVLIIRQTIQIKTRHQHQFTMATNLANDIRNAGGYLTEFSNDPTNQETDLAATVPSQYMDRIEPLLRKSKDHINPHYETWAIQAATQLPEKHNAADQPTKLNFKIKGRFFDSRQRELIVTESIVLGAIGLVTGVIMLAFILNGRPY